LPQAPRGRKIFFVLAWLNAFIGGQTSQQALDQVREFLRTNRIDRDLELKVLEVMDELERTVRIRAKFDLTK
jgi:aminopeptidase N